MLNQIKNQILTDISQLSLLISEFENKMDEYRNAIISYNELNVLKSKFNFFQRKFDNRYKKIINECEKINDNIERLNREKDEYIIKITSFFDNHIEIFQGLYIPKNLEYRSYELFQTVENAIDRINKKNTIKDFNMTFYDAIKFLNDNNLDVYLDENDKNIIKNSISFDSLNNFVLVHKTNYLPIDNHISTSLESGVKFNNIILDRVGSIEYASARNTLHFAVNGEVSSHIYGNWEQSKYAIVVPFSDMPISNLRSGAVMDTFFEGGIDLSENAILLCPLEDVEKAKELNNITVIGYKGSNVTGYADALVGMLGKKVEEIGEWSWINSDDAANYYRSFKNVFPTVLPHSSTFESDRDRVLAKVNSLLSFIDKLIESGIVLTNEEITTFIYTNKIFEFDNASFFEQNKQLYNEIILDIDNFLSKYEIKLSENVVNRTRDFIFDNQQLSEDEKELCRNVTGRTENYNNKEFFFIYNIFTDINNYNIVNNNIVENYNNHTMGFTGVQLISLISSITSIFMAVLGIIFLFITK